ncbi:MAG: ABC transporter ATP-binding protein [Chloroflexi bacterium]|nr:ABC transporter ATP-binding protein [Chloroflexota bacterium]
MLRVSDLSFAYGRIRALDGVTLEVAPGEVVTIIGSNGAGKTTLLRAISGIYRPQSGSIAFENRDITRLSPEKIVGLGVSQVPEGRQVFVQQSVEVNLELGAFHRHGHPKAEIRNDYDFVYALFPRLKERARQIAGTLSGGEQQMLAIGRALMARPRLLLLDEPSMGLAPLMVKEIFDVLTELSRKGTTILLVEQNAKMALRIAHRGYVLETGRVVLSDKSSQLLETDEVKMIYLGQKRAK